MPGENHHHFPTFHKMGNVFRSGPTSGGAAHWIARTFLTERGLIRAALYGMLIVCVVHVAAIRVFMFQYGIGWSPMFGGRGFGNGPPLMEGSVTAMVFTVTYMILGSYVGELAPLVAVLCLVGLAASARHPVGVPVATPELTPAVPDLEPPAEEKRPPQPAARHPLDPDPDDLPPERRWPKTSRPSR
ncbi:MAG: hypothetical protein JWN86_3018 [Planctomycetota bacterium]|nr:hypothetical protein [Planctomycetota bacterium]